MQEEPTVSKPVGTRTDWGDMRMKMDRLIGIITTLQRHKKVTAPYLAEKFEVSRRTINRDIETICRAGIPIVTTQGGNGGISLMEGFYFDTTVFTQQELAAVFTGLKTLDSVSSSPRLEKFAQKIGGDPAVSLSEHMLIDLASFYKEDLAGKIEQIQGAIREHRCISFHYYYGKGEEDRLIEPCWIVFKWSDWYVFGFCRSRQDFRMFKLRRLWELKTTEIKFETRNVPEGKLQFGSHMKDDYRITALYDSAVKYKLVEEYGPDCFTEREDGLLYTRWGFADPDEAVHWFLGFGDKVRVTEPPEMVAKVKAAIQAMAEKYSEHDTTVS